VSLSEQASEDAEEAKLPTSVKTPKLEANGKRHALKDNGFAPDENFNLANKRTIIKPPFGRERGTLPLRFLGKRDQHLMEALI